jgi:hypothetical protein
MKRITVSVAGLVAAALIACSGADTAPSAVPTVPVQPASSPIRPNILTAWSATTAFGRPGEEVPPPTVRVTDGSGKPVAGVAVAFTLTIGHGAIGRPSALTDGNGMASVGTWRLDSPPGTNSLVATVDGVGQIMFTAMGRIATMVATYDLQTIAGQALPLTYSGGGSSWTVTGGHYVLFDDGTCTFGYDIPELPRSRTPCTYVRSDSTVRFYQLPGTYPSSSFYAERGGLFSTGTVRGGVMFVKYEDFIDFDDEVYTLGTSSAASPR